MTFKHVKFEDSSTMRSLVKVATEKGWIQEEPLKKSASVKQADLTPSTELMDNLLKLCQGLRAQGFDKHAEDVEKHFVSFKQAQTLYEVNKEKGEDLIHDAHPQGSHKMEDVDSEEATFEDILDKHMKTMKVVEKEPTGKLTEASDIFRAVKLVLADTAEDQANYQEAQKMFSGLVTQLVGTVNKVLSNEDVSDWTYRSRGPGSDWFRSAPEASTGMPIGTTGGHLKVVSENLNDLVRKGPSFETIGELKKNVNSFVSLVNHSDNINAGNKTKYVSEAMNVYTQSDQVLRVLRGEAAGGPAGGDGQLQVKEIQVTADPLIGKATALINRLKGYLSLGVVSRNQGAKDWVATEIKQISDIMTRFNKALQVDQGESVRADLNGELATKETEVNGFYDQVRKAGGAA